MSAAFQVLMMMKLSHFLSTVLWLTTLSSCIPTQGSPSTDLAIRADASLTDYLGIFFLGSKENIYFYLSDGNNAFSYKALNKGNPVLVPTLGTKGVRDPSIVSAVGADARKKWWIIGTDLQIGTVSLSSTSNLYAQLLLLNEQQAKTFYRQHGTPQSAKAPSVFSFGSQLISLLGHLNVSSKSKMRPREWSGLQTPSGIRPNSNT